MSFSEKMRESLGATGVRLRVTPTSESHASGATLGAQVALEGGTTTAHIDALVLRLIEADRYWTDGDGNRVEESEAAGLEDRGHLTAAWDRRTIAQARMSVDHDVEASSESTIPVELEIPAECGSTSISRAHTLNVQADISGQIDPTANARVIVSQG